MCIAVDLLSRGCFAEFGHFFRLDQTCETGTLPQFVPKANFFVHTRIPRHCECDIFNGPMFSNLIKTTTLVLPFRNHHGKFARNRETSSFVPGEQFIIIHEAHEFLFTTDAGLQYPRLYSVALLSHGSICAPTRGANI